MKKILTSILAIAMTATCAISSFSAGAFAWEAQDDTVDKLLADGYVEVEKPDESESILNYLFEYDPYGVYGKDDDYVVVRYGSWNEVYLKAKSNYEEMLAIYQTYADKLNFDHAKQEDGAMSLLLYDKYVKDGSFVDKSELVTAMIKEMNAAGVAFEIANYEKITGSYSKYSRYANLRISNLTDEELADAKQVFCDCYYTTYPSAEGSVASSEVLFANKDDSGQSKNFPSGFLNVIVPALEEKYEGISIETEDNFFSLSSDNQVNEGFIDFLDISDGTASGDVNLDGKIDLTDTILVKKYEAGAVTLEETQKANADLDGNGTVDSNDAVQLLRFLLRLEESIG